MTKWNLPPDPQVAKEVLQNETRQHKMSLESGWLGRVFGTGRNAPVQVVSLALVLLLLAGVLYTFHGDAPNHLGVVDFWKVLSPIITLLVGFLAGTYSKTGGE